MPAVRMTLDVATTLLKLCGGDRGDALAEAVGVVVYLAGMRGADADQLFGVAVTTLERARVDLAARRAAAEAARSAVTS